MYICSTCNALSTSFLFRLPNLFSAHPYFCNAHTHTLGTRLAFFQENVIFYQLSHCLSHCIHPFQMPAPNLRWLLQWLNMLILDFKGSWKLWAKGNSLRGARGCYQSCQLVYHRHMLTQTFPAKAGTWTGMLQISLKLSFKWVLFFVQWK